MQTSYYFSPMELKLDTENIPSVCVRLKKREMNRKREREKREKEEERSYEY